MANIIGIISKSVCFKWAPIPIHVVHSEEEADFVFMLKLEDLSFGAWLAFVKRLSLNSNKMFQCSEVLHTKLQVFLIAQNTSDPIFPQISSSYY